MTFDEFKDSLKGYIGERNDDDTLSLLEAMDSVEIPTQEDALNDLKNQLSAALAATEEKDAEWRKRYRDRFFGVESDPNPEPDPEPESEPETMSAEDAAALWLKENGSKYQ